MMQNSRTKIELLQSAIIIGDSIWWDKEEGGGGQGDDWKALGGRRASVEGS